MATPETERVRARWDIIQAANRFKMSFQRKLFGPYVYAPKLLDMRHIQQAVHLVRQRQLVSDDTLKKAGFNAKRRRGR